MSQAVAEAPDIAEVLHIVHPQDMAMLRHYGADITDQTLVSDYQEYRETFGRPGMMDSATLHRLTVEQKRRKNRKGK